MKKSIIESVKCIIRSSILITLIFIFVMIFFIAKFSPEPNSLRPVYDALYIGGTFFSGIATITAAYIASKMFNDWKVEHNNKTLSDEALKIFKSLEEFKAKVKSYSDSIHNQKNLGKPFTRPYPTVFGKDIILSDEIRQILIFQDDYITRTGVLLGLLPNTTNKDTLLSIGIVDAEECLNHYRKIVQYNYIMKEGIIDSNLMIHTAHMKHTLSKQVDTIQQNLRKYIIFDTDDNS